mgnify:CR=1 FL=1
MWCRNCNIELKDKKCLICGRDTVEDVPVEMSILDGFGKDTDFPSI